MPHLTSVETKVSSLFPMLLRHLFRHMIIALITCPYLTARYKVRYKCRRGAWRVMGIGTALEGQKAAVAAPEAVLPVVRARADLA